MINTEKTKEILFSYVKSLQTIDPCIPKLAPDLVSEDVQDVWVLQNLSGLENLLTPEKVYRVIEKFSDMEEMNIAQYDAQLSYAKGDIVKYDDGTNEFFYVCRVANTGQTPSWDSDFWETSLSDFFRNSILTGCSYEIDQYFSKLQAVNYIPDIMNAQRLYTAYYNKRELKFKTENGNYTQAFRGMRFTLAQIKNIQVQISKIGLYSDTEQTIPFYLYHSSKTQPIGTYQVQITAQDVNNFVWKSFQDLSGNALKEVVLNFVSQEYNQGGYFWLGFYEDDVQGKIYSSEWDGWHGGNYSGYCGDYRYWITSAIPTEFKDEQTNKPNFFELDDVFSPLTFSNIAPFNLELRAVCNYTQGMELNSRAWAKVVAYYTAEKILRTALNSLRRNEDAEFFLREAQLLIYGSEGGNYKSISEIRKTEEKSLQVSVNQLDSICFKRVALRRIF